jgi:hypothetical protein
MQNMLKLYQNTRKRIIRCFGMHIYLQIANGVHKNLNFQHESVKSDKQAVKEMEELLAKNIHEALQLVKIDPFEQIRV